MIGTTLFHIGSFGVPTMGVCCVVGAVLAVLLSWLLRKKSALDWNGEVVDAIIWAVFLGFVGMKVLYWIVTPGVFKTAFRDGFFPGILALLMEGMVFYGGLIGGIVGIILVARRKKKNFFEFSDLMAPCFALAHAFGRIGCLLVGCCYGVAKGEPMLFGAATYQGTCAVFYPDLPNNEGAGPAWRLPVPLFEAIFLLLLCAVLVLIYLREKKLGRVTGWYLVLYALWRFGIEGFRGDKIRGVYGLFSTSQWISFGILIAGVVILILSRKWKRGEPFIEFHEDDLTVPEAEEEDPAEEDVNGVPADPEPEEDPEAGQPSGDDGE
jgi:phosphatidylglycerol:prolipoprotein diacylglycerol transferase